MNAFSSVELPQSGVAVAIPVHNEEDYIAACLQSLARQDFPGPFEVVAFLNNCTDGTLGIARRLAPSLPYRLRVRERVLDRASANAGVARRLAMREAEALVATDGVLLTTDADSQVPPDWISTRVAQLDAGADAVAGMVEMNDEDAAALPPHLIADEEKTQELGTLLDEIDWLLDPDAADPWPRHTQHSGANIAVRASWLKRVGGIPAIPLGEDRQFFTELRRADARIRHSREAVVIVSGRTTGRAAGGMADTIARRMREKDAWLDDCFEPAPDRVRRALLRRSARGLWAEGTAPDAAEALSRQMHLPSPLVRRALAGGPFGKAWSDMEEASPVLRQRLIPAEALEREKNIALEIVRDLRRRSSPTVSGHRADSGSFVSA